MDGLRVVRLGRRHRRAARFGDDARVRVRVIRRFFLGTRIVMFRRFLVMMRRLFVTSGARHTRTLGDVHS